MAEGAEQRGSIQKRAAAARTAGRVVNKARKKKVVKVVTAFCKRKSMSTPF